MTHRIYPINTARPWPKNQWWVAANATTPETESTTHYFGGVTRDFRLDDPAFDAAMIDNHLAVRDQDLVALALLEVNAARFGDTTRELSALQDAGAIRVRRMLAAQIEAEST